MAVAPEKNAEEERNADRVYENEDYGDGEDRLVARAGAVDGVVDGHVVCHVPVGADFIFAAAEHCEAFARSRRQNDVENKKEALEKESGAVDERGRLRSTTDGSHLQYSRWREIGAAFLESDERSMRDYAGKNSTW